MNWKWVNITSYRCEFSYRDVHPKWKLFVCKVLKIKAAKAYTEMVYIKTDAPIEINNNGFYDCFRLDTGFNLAIYHEKNSFNEYKCTYELGAGTKTLFHPNPTWPAPKQLAFLSNE